MDLSLLFFPSAVLLGALHALEPGHAKTLTAAYLIGTKGTPRDAILLGISVATTHSAVVIGLSVLAVLWGREAFAEEAEKTLALASSVAVVVLGIWLLVRRIPGLTRALKARRHEQKSGAPKAFSGRLVGMHRSHGYHDHSLLSDEEHARAHMADLPDYVARGERPSVAQVMAFGAVGGLVPCPAAISVMLLSLSVSESGKGLILVLGFSLGLAITLVGIGMLVVLGISKLTAGGKMSQLAMFAPTISAAMVIFSGLLGMAISLWH